MKLNKTLLLGLLLPGLVFTACKDDEGYQKAEEPGIYKVGFANEENKVLEFTDTELTVDLIRVDEGSLPELKVPITVLDAPDFLTVPEEAVFAEGETTTTITMKIGEGMEAFTDYQLSLMFDQSYTNPYVDSLNVDLIPRYNITFLKEDYKTIATATFLDQVLYEDEWDIEIQYSAMLDLYRIPDCMENGTAWYFKWNGPDAEEQEFYFTDSEGKKASCVVAGEELYGFFSGITHSKYGNIYATILDGYPCGYDVDEDGPYFVFAMEFLVNAGSFGANYEYIYNIEFIDE